MKLRRRLYGLAVLLGALALAGCGGAGPATVAPSTATEPATPSAVVAPSATPAPAAYPVETSAPTAYPAGTPLPQELPSAYPIPIASETAPPGEGKGADPAIVDLAKQDLAQRLSVAVDQISVVSSEYVDWPDSSLGCAEPGMAYSQVITPGYRVILQQGQKQYDYHTGLRSTLVLCTKLR